MVSTWNGVREEIQFYNQVRAVPVCVDASVWLHQLGSALAADVVTVTL
jgi:hypothetical protein